MLFQEKQCNPNNDPLIDLLLNLVAVHQPLLIPYLKISYIGENMWARSFLYMKVISTYKNHD